MKTTEDQLSLGGPPAKILQFLFPDEKRLSCDFSKMRCLTVCSYHLMYRYYSKFK